ncbi:DUF7344 domain-containing protein [Halopiger aswanensis]|uniref:DUF7344 domain-containing protein n=1 Tax=Halopiger aswanensis TaxID=148449 RepID=A0A419VZB4_9EURY|nr:hypothetical protein [Halopiger aswanensis]RKD88556.1 hypothetical protein ATJ93_4210 [Halopiger aswanensis]
MANNGVAGANGESLSLDAILDALSHHHRRTLFRWLRNQPDQRANAEDVLNHLINQEQERMGKAPNPNHIEVTLHHVHAPKLSGLRLVTYDDAAEEYQYHTNDRLEKWLDLIDAEHELE